jgi:hypothetical protein
MMFRDGKSWMLTIGRYDGWFFCLQKNMPEHMVTNRVSFHWKIPFRNSKHRFIFAWPRRDNRWARWRYEAFTQSGEVIAWKVSPQKVFW